MGNIRVAVPIGTLPTLLIADVVRSNELVKK